jgi:hypothetical protein
MDIAVRLLTALLAAAPAWGIAADANPSTLPFRGSGTIRLDLPSGAVEVIGTADERITVSWHSTTSRDLEGKVKVDLREESGGKEAVVAIEGPSNHVRYRIEVPRRSSVVMRMSAGDCLVHGIQGDLTANLLAGNLELQIDEPRDYRAVRGSVTSGGLTAKPWGIDKGGLLRSFEVTGPGAHEINAKVLAGQLVIRQM